MSRSGELDEAPAASTDDTLGADGSGPAKPDVGDLARGAVLGRYVVLDVLGAGGMGVVYAAYDPELDRKVALKVLLPAAEGGSAGRARLLREAQALARLSHPNIVAVHDVGTLGERVWIAMEFVAGTTLGVWLRERPRSWEALVEAMTAAGRGLAAAHAAGLVHRDFKPDNVMIGEQGRVRVMDFGLARSIEADVAAETDAHQPSVPSIAELQPRQSTLREALTRAGALAGTPAYMAPEQFASASVDARADQFSFCVAAWEGLFGERPFRGGSLVELAAAVTSGEIRAPAGGSRVPGWLRKAVQRGLAPAPDERWPTMEALLEALARGRSRARTRRWLVGIGALAFLSIGGVTANQLDLRARTAACDAAGASIADVWSDDVRADLREALLATGVSYAETTADRVMPWLDAQAQAWQTASTEACLDADVRHVWSVDTRERSLWCLDERRMELEALVTELSVADDRVVAKAVSAAAQLVDVGACRDARILERLPPPPSQRREEVRAVRAELSRAGALGHAGKYDEGLALARAVHQQAESLEWPPLLAAAREAEASLLEPQASFEEAEALGVEAYFQAASIGAWDVAARAAAKLVFVVGYRRARHAEGLAWGRHAELAEANAGDPEHLREAERLGNVATVSYASGDYPQAIVLYERALAIQEHMLGADHPTVADSLNNLANVLIATGDYARARTLLERAVEIRETAFGADHPDLAASLNNLANVDHATGDYAQARVLFERAHAIWEKALGAEHPMVATSLSNLAAMHATAGEYVQARALFERALSIRERTLGPNHPDVADTLANLALLDHATGDQSQARALQERALAILETSLGPDHPDVANSVSNLAAIHAELGDYARARAMNERALAIMEKTLGADHPNVASNLANLAMVYEAEADYVHARKLQERVLAIREKALGPDHPDVGATLADLAGLDLAEHDAAGALPLAERAVAIHDRDEDVRQGELDARFALARALVATGGDHARARAQAEQARDGWRAGASVSAKDLAEVEAWLAAQGGDR